ncbi:MAG: hypothetical protein IPL40_10585 [Proteobacteria bacterium]|nr:hypothetical protein [Pseudomonadota bacterium]
MFAPGALRPRAAQPRLGWLLALVLACCNSHLAAAATRDIARNPAERELLTTLAQDKLIQARQQAERLLHDDPRSFVGFYALSHVFREEEGNLPRALHHLQRAAALLAERLASAAGDPLLRHWDRRLLLEEETLLGEMDRRSDQLAVLERYAHRYGPAADQRRVWPLMKLHRYAEATRLARRAAEATDLERRISGYNGLLSLEFERERPQQCFGVALEGLRRTGDQSCILNLNAAEAAFAVFRFDEVERLANRSLQAPIHDCPASAHTHLANLYLLQGDFRRAIAAVQEARAQSVPRRLRQQFEMNFTAWLTRLLFALGRFDRAFELAERVLEAPDRVGLLSYSAELMETIYTLDDYAALQGRIEQLREERSARGGLRDRLGRGLELLRLRLLAWARRRQAARLLAQHGLLRGLLRPYLKPLPSWNLPLLAEVAGDAVVGTVIRELRQSIEMRAATDPYYAAVEGEGAARRADHAVALKRGRLALQQLPDEEVLLRARVAAWTGASAYALGDRLQARQAFEEVLDRWPTALRVLGLPLPVRIRADATPAAQLVAARLEHSRRLTTDALGLGFVVAVNARGRALELCLLAPRGRRVDCVQGPAPGSAQDEAAIVALIDAFHRQAFAPKIDLTQQDINGLDGSAVGGRADDVIKKALGD